MVDSKNNAPNQLLKVNNRWIIRACVAESTVDFAKVSTGFFGKESKQSMPLTRWQIASRNSVRKGVTQV